MVLVLKLEGTIVLTHSKRCGKGHLSQFWWFLKQMNIQTARATINQGCHGASQVNFVNWLVSFDGFNISFYHLYWSMVLYHALASMLGFGIGLVTLVPTRIWRDWIGTSLRLLSQCLYCCSGTNSYVIPDNKCLRLGYDNCPLQDLRSTYPPSSSRTARRHVLDFHWLSGDVSRGSPHAASCFPSHAIMAHRL